MCLSAVSKSIGLLYVSTCLLGLFLSNITPTVYSLVEIFIGSNRKEIFTWLNLKAKTKHSFYITATSTAFVILCAASGEMILPVIAANVSVVI